MNDISLYEKIPTEAKNFPIRFRFYGTAKGFAPHWHEHLELLYFVYGSCRINCGASSVEASEGDLILINSNELHGIDEKKEVRYYCVIINPSFFADVNFEHVFLKTHIKNDGRVKSSFDALIYEYETKKEGSDMRVKSIVYSLMAYLLENYKLEQLSGREYDVKMTKMIRLNSVLSFISKHYQEKISTAELAAMCFLSECYFCRFFKNATGCSVVDYINRFRAERAAVLLRNTPASITEIASDVGFYDVNFFSRVFKKYMKKSPSEYRR